MPWRFINAGAKGIYSPCEISLVAQALAATGVMRERWCKTSNRHKNLGRGIEHFTDDGNFTEEKRHVGFVAVLINFWQKL